jgi:cobalamin biosynthetic protein CobC
MLEHGGKLREAAKEFHIPLSDWLDLSTGVSPFSYPCGSIPEWHWRRLPEENDGLEEAAKSYYGGNYVLPVAGSQAAIQTLPLLRARAKAGFLHPSYNEHIGAWSRHGHAVEHISIDGLLQAAANLDVIVLCNPNNPTGAQVNVESLLQIASLLEKRRGWLIVDEAFMDANAHGSLVGETGMNETIIALRSFGKFFGLAGARLGFMFAWPQLILALSERLGPWTVPGPTRFLAKTALQDRQWINSTRDRLQKSSRRLQQTLIEHGLTPSGGTPLFHWVKTNEARTIHTKLAQTAVFTRLFEDPPSIRFGLPASEDDWNHLESALAKLNHLTHAQV